MATTTDRTPARTAHAPTPTKGRPNAHRGQDEYRGKLHAAKHAKPLPVQSRRRGFVRGFVDCHLAGLLALLVVVALLTVGGIYAR